MLINALRLLLIFLPGKMKISSGDIFGSPVFFHKFVLWFAGRMR